MKGILELASNVEFLVRPDLLTRSSRSPAMLPVRSRGRVMTLAQDIARRMLERRAATVSSVPAPKPTTRTPHAGDDTSTGPQLHEDPPSRQLTRHVLEQLGRRPQSRARNHKRVISSKAVTFAKPATRIDEAAWGAPLEDA